ncbi:hypothetical protein SME36J_52850 (plasmid) [Serratia marcescens]|nr:hypothetical protein SME36J_52850 [Serratia marcescens]
MSMKEFRRLAARMDQHMQQLGVEGVTDPADIFNRMVGYVPELHQIWVNTSDQQLMALSREFPGFFRYAQIVEEASVAERNKTSRSYDGIDRVSGQHRHTGERLLTTAATLEHGFKAFRASGLSIFDSKIKELNIKHKQWLSDLDDFKKSLRSHGADPRILNYVEQVYGNLAERIRNAAS